MTPTTILRALAARPAAGEDLVVERRELDAGLPFEWPLAAVRDVALKLAVIVPTGNAVQWRDRPQNDVVFSGDLAAEGAGPLLLVRTGGRAVAATPLVRRRTWNVPNPEGLWRGMLQIVCVTWRIHAGAMVRPGAYGSYLEYGVRYLEAGNAPVGPLRTGWWNGGFR